MGIMRRMMWIVWIGAAAALAGGCVSAPTVHSSASPEVAAGGPGNTSPVWVAMADSSYAQVFERVLDVVGDTFEISYANRYEGTVESYPRVAPGLEQPWKTGSPSCYERLYATLQSVRHRAVVNIQRAEDGGFFIDVKVYRELEDLARPIRAAAGAASFRNDPTVERQYEVIDDSFFESNWIPNGRDYAFEQCLLRQITRCMAGG
jgi:hypothetical protein